MKLSKVVISLLLCVSLLILSVTPAMAAPKIKENASYVWEMVDDEWTCKDSLGNPVKGFAKNDDKVYYLDRFGTMKTGWVKYLGDWYYFYKSSDDVDEELAGTLATETWIDNYYVNRYGIMTKTR